MDRAKKRWRREHVRRPKPQVAESVPQTLNVFHPATGTTRIVPESWATLKELVYSYPVGASRDQIAHDVIEAVRLMITSNRAYEFGRDAEDQWVSIYAAWLAASDAYKYQTQAGAVFHNAAYSALMFFSFQAFSGNALMETSALYADMAGEDEVKRIITRFKQWARRKHIILPQLIYRAELIQ